MTDKPPNPSPAGTPDDEELEALFDEEQGAERRRYQLKKPGKQRLDVFLSERVGSASRAKIQKLIELGGVTVNGEPTKPAAKIKAGDLIEIILPPQAVREILPEPIPLDILHEDRDLIVVNKQANLIVHPARGQHSGTLVNALAHHLQQAASGEARPLPEPSGDGEGVPGLSDVGADEQRPGIVHRLDRYTTGVMVIAKRDETHWKLATQFERREPLKVYLALVHGSPEGPGGAIEEPLGKHPTIREAYAVRHDSQGKPSLTLYRVRERYHGYSLVELELKTGRTHQIRIHLSYMGWPIVGDVVYGGEPVGEAEIDEPPLAAAHRRMLTFARDRSEGQKIEAAALAREDLFLTHPALHAAMLRLRHPASGETMTFHAPLHEPMASLVGKLRERPAEGPVAKSGFWIDLDPVVGPRADPAAG